LPKTIKFNQKLIFAKNLKKMLPKMNKSHKKYKLVQVSHTKLAAQRKQSKISNKS
jgi:hypothetical protein